MKFETLELDQEYVAKLQGYKFGESWVERCIRSAKAKLWLDTYCEIFDREDKKLGNCVHAGFMSYRRKDGQPITQDDEDAMKVLDHGQSNWFTVADDRSTMTHRWYCDSGDQIIMDNDFINIAQALTKANVRWYGEKYEWAEDTLNYYDIPDDLRWLAKYRIILLDGMLWFDGDGRYLLECSGDEMTSWEQRRDSDRGDAEKRCALIESWFNDGTQQERVVME